MDAVSLVQSFFVNYLVSEICHPPYGCFTREPPFDNSLFPLPSSPSTTFWLQSRQYADPLQVKPIQSEFQWFNETKKIFLIAHGFLESSESWWIQPMVKALLNKEDAYVIVVNWKDGARTNYNQAVGNSRLVGREIAYLLESLFNNTKLVPSQVHLAGFSLGAHVMGFAGEALKNNGIIVDRITGLDPAGPSFEDADTRMRLDPSDANFVDVIHSDTKTIYVTGLGYKGRLGHVDFYPNGGVTQPGCRKITLNLFSNTKLRKYIGCGHYRAVLFFTESISNQNSFQAFKCRNYKTFLEARCWSNGTQSNNMGYHVNRQNHGAFYLKTNKETPFSGYHYVIKVTTGTKDYADSFASVQFKLIGTKGQSSFFDVGQAVFTNGSAESFTILSKNDYGNLVKIEVSHHVQFLSDAWFLSQIQVSPKWNSKRYFSCVNRWISGRTQEFELTEGYGTRQKC